MDVGVHFINFALPGGPEGIRGHVADTAEAAEEAGCTMFTFMDHYFQMEQFSRSEDPMLEGYDRAAARGAAERALTSSTWKDRYGAGR